MATLAVLREKNANFSVHRLHVNIWSVAGLGRRKLYFDLGLELLTETELPYVDVLLPFTAAPDKWTDLSKEIGVLDTARLIFGTDVVVTDEGRTIALPREVRDGQTVEEARSLTIIPIEAARELTGSTAAFLKRERMSLWRLTLSQPATRQRNTYLRIRFHVRHHDRLWISPDGRGVLTDLRVSDIRETISPGRRTSGLESIALRFAPITSLNILIVVPVHLRQRTVSPAFRYVRLFEGSVWQPYLRGRAPTLFARDRLVLYHWSHKSLIDTAEGRTAPFRGFLLLTPGGDPPRLVGRILSVLITAAVAGLIATVVVRPDLIPVDRLSDAADTLVGYATGLGILGMGAVALRVLDHWDRWTFGWTFLGSTYETVEESLFRLLALSRD
jgi:hypothetical protein